MLDMEDPFEPIKHASKRLVAHVPNRDARTVAEMLRFSLRGGDLSVLLGLEPSERDRFGKFRAQAVACGPADDGTGSIAAGQD